MSDFIPHSHHLNHPPKKIKKTSDLIHTIDKETLPTSTEFSTQQPQITHCSQQPMELSPK
jgi:hypothetical protein